MPAGDQFCSRTADEMRLARNVGTIHSPVQVFPATCSSYTVVASKTLRIQTITFHGNAHLEQFMHHSGLLYRMYCDVSRDLEGRDLVKQPTLGF